LALVALQHVQTKREVEELLCQAGVRPRKRFGQHFLIDGNLMRRLVESADLDPQDLVIEIGPGTGGLTDLLVGSAGRVIAVELDRILFEILEERFADAESISLVLGDALASKHAIRQEVIEAIHGFESDAGGRVKLVANLPYQIATPLVLNLVVDHPQVRRLCFTVQAEVGGRFIAGPCSKAYGPISIVVQTLCEVATIARIPPPAFWPRPDVDSVMLRLDAKESPPLSSKESGVFAKFVRGVFDHRRKTLRSALGYVVSDDAREHLCQLFDTTRRPEALCVEEWLDVFRALASWDSLDAD
jgi:16S rRNA (adenine1518-N6/adenine1519-N6)-dimethyltransferase